MMPIMWRRLGLFATTLFTLVSCGDGSGEASANPEDAFVQELRDTYPNPSYLTNDDARAAILEQGESFCDMLDEGFTSNEIREVALNAGVDPAAIQPLLDAAQNHLCSD